MRKHIHRNGDDAKQRNTEMFSFINYDANTSEAEFLAMLDKLNEIKIACMWSNDLINEKEAMVWKERISSRIDMMRGVSRD